MRYINADTVLAALAAIQDGLHDSAPDKTVSISNSRQRVSGLIRNIENQAQESTKLEWWVENECIPGDQPFWEWMPCSMPTCSNQKRHRYVTGWKDGHIKRPDGDLNVYDPMVTIIELRAELRGLADSLEETTPIADVYRALVALWSKL